MGIAVTVVSRPFESMHLRFALSLACGVGLLFASSVGAQPPIDTKRFAVDCQRLRGNPQRGLGTTKEMNTGFTIVLSDTAHRYYNAPASSGLNYWVVPGDIGLLNRTHKPVTSFTSKNQVVQVYGAIRPEKIYTIFITHGDGKAKNAAARTSIKARRCGPYTEPGIIPNELRHNRIKPLAST